MSIGLLFWILMICWIALGVWTNRAAGWNWGLGAPLLEFVLFALLGWHVFGPMVHG